jgi:hypothetical protein
VWSNNFGDQTGIRSELACGMPAAGAQYARATGDDFYVDPTFPIPRPVPFTVTEIRTLVPDGADGISFKWNFFQNEGSGSGFNDGMEIAIVAADQVTVLVPLIYVDSNDPFAPGGCIDPVTGGVDVLNDGIETFSTSFAPVPFGSYLSIVVWNDEDTAEDSSGLIDCIAWGNPTTPSWELGDQFGPRCVDLTPNQSFRVGTAMSVQMQAGLPFLEGDHCMVAQVTEALGTVPQFITPGIAGPLFVRPGGNPVTILSEGLLTGGVTPGRGPVVTFTVSDPAVCGAGVVIQAYVITEQLTNPTWTTAVFGWFR